MRLWNDLSRWYLNHNRNASANFMTITNRFHWLKISKFLHPIKKNIKYFTKIKADWLLFQVIWILCNVYWTWCEEYLSLFENDWWNLPFQYIFFSIFHFRKKHKKRWKMENKKGLDFPENGKRKMENGKSSSKTIDFCNMWTFTTIQ